MKTLLLGFALSLTLALGATTAHAHDAYDDSQSNPLQLAAYAINPAGYALEWLFMRPIHFVVSHPQLERIFGHGPHEDPFSSEPYQAEDYN